MANEQKLEDIYEAVTKAIDVARVKADNALNSGKISESEWQEAKDKWGRLEITQLEIKGIMIDEELKKKLLKNNPDSPISKIEQATNRLDKSAGKINDFNNFLSEIDKALKIVGSTIKFISPLI
jgi:glutathionylspermidine synthase